MFFIERQADEVVYNLLFQVEALIEVVAEHVLLGDMGECVFFVGKPDEYVHRVGYHPVDVESQHAGIYQGRWVRLSSVFFRTQVKAG